MYSKTSSFSPRSITSFIEDVVQNGFGRAMSEDRVSDSSDHAPVNIQDTDAAYEMYLMAPGLKKEDFKLNVDKNVLTVSYEHKVASEETAGRWLRNEYKMRSFRRSFTLNEKIDTAAISARYNDGVLNVSLPKKASLEEQAQEISVG